MNFIKNLTEIWINKNFRTFKKFRCKKFSAKIVYGKLKIATKICYAHLFVVYEEVLK